MHQFNEHHPELKGFSAFYDTEIMPRLAGDEARRAAAQTKMYRALAVVFSVMALTIIFILVKYAVLPVNPLVPIMFIIMVGIGSLYITSYVLFKDIEAATKQNVLAGICKFLGWSFQEQFEPPVLFDSFVNLGLLPSRFTKSHFEDRITGITRGTRFEFFESHLKNKNSGGTKNEAVTVFRGQLLALEFNQKFSGRTVVLRDKGWLQGEKKQDMKRVGLVDPVFEKIFEAYGTDQVEARYLLTPTFMQRLVDLENSVDGKKIRFGFTGGLLLIAVETANRYESGSMFKPLIDAERTQKVLDEIGAIYDVIDGVLGSSVERHKRT